MLSRHHRVALLDAAGDRVLVVDGGDGPALPSLAEEWPDDVHLRAAVGGVVAWAVAPPLREDDGQVTHVLQLAPGDPAPEVPRSRWLAVADLEGPEVSAAARDHLARDATTPGDGRADWFRPGWRDEVVAWVAERCAVAGLVSDGEPVPHRLWAISAVVRFPVRGSGGTRDLWFKAVCDGFHAEPALTRAVADLAPGLLPGIVAVDDARGWMLLEPVPSPDAAGVHTPERLVETARAVARLQIESTAHLDALDRDGLPDRGLDATLASMHEVLTASVELPLLSGVQRAAAAAVEPSLAVRVRELWSGGVADALVHGDLHVHNTTWDDGPVLFDWTDACRSHPYLDGVHLARSVAREQGAGGEDAAVREAYLEPWRIHLPGVDHDEVWRRAVDVERVFTLISYEQIYRAQPPWARWELATVAADLLVELSSA